MKPWVLIPLGPVAVVLVWLALDPERREAIAAAVGLTAPPQPAAAANAKPICALPVNPKVAAPVDCIPQHLANLPPDPGQAGKLTIDGIDADKDGLRDDVQRWIAENWGHSQLAVKALTISAQQELLAVRYGDSLGKAETRKQFGPDSMRKSACTSDLETTEMLEGRAFEKVRLQVTNTPERWKRAREFDYMFANSILMGFEGTPTEACGFDPEALAAREGKQTISTQLRAESTERTEREEREPALKEQK
jgi:hypothetical protein